MYICSPVQYKQCGYIYKRETENMCLLIKKTDTREQLLCNTNIDIHYKILQGQPSAKRLKLNYIKYIVLKSVFLEMVQTQK